MLLDVKRRRCDGASQEKSLQEYETVSGVVMQVIAWSGRLWNEEADKAALRERVTFVGGDFFKSGALLV